MVDGEKETPEEARERRRVVGEMRKKWKTILDRLERERDREFGETILSVAIAAWAKSTMGNYLCHIRALAQYGESEEEYVCRLDDEGKSADWLLCAASAIRAVEELGLLERKPGGLLWKMCLGTKKEKGGPNTR